MTEDFVTKRLESMMVALKGRTKVIVNHDYQSGRLISIFSSECKEYNEAVKKSFSVFSLYVDDSTYCGLEYVDNEDSSFYGFRLKEDMASIGFDHICTFTPGHDYVDIPYVRKNSKYDRRIEGVNEGKYCVGRYPNENVAEAVRDVMISNLLNRTDIGNFSILKESDLYKVIDTNGNVPTSHPRVCQVAQGIFVSHPLCKECGKHTGMCRQYGSYPDAVEWADMTDVKCWDCTPEKEKARLEKIAEESECDSDDFDDCSCSCPLEGGQ